MARVPLKATVDIQMFGGSVGINATSIIEVIKYHFPAYAGGNSSDAAFTFLRANASILQFHPDVRPATIAEVNSTQHLRGFPMVIDNTKWHMKNKIAT